MADRNRRWTLLLAGLAILAMVLVAAGLSNLELLPGRLPPRVEVPAESEAARPPSFRSELISVIVAVMGVLTVVFLVLFIFYLLFSDDSKKRLLIGLGLLFWLVLLYILSRANPPPPEEVQPTPLPTLGPTVAAPTALPSGADAPIVDLVMRPPVWLVWLGAVVLALLAIGALAGIAWLIWAQGQRTTTPLEQLAREAEQALGALEAGADINDTIMRCYLEMSEILKRERGIVRQEAMTPREFARALRGTGLPQERVTQLTGLFEKVRYGASTPDEGEERQAVLCLEAVVEACRSGP